MEFLGPQIVGEDSMQRSALWWAMKRMMHANETAIGAIDIALHDIGGKALGVPVAALLGGVVRETVPALTMAGGCRAVGLGHVHTFHALDAQNRDVEGVSLLTDTEGSRALGLTTGRMRPLHGGARSPGEGAMKRGAQKPSRSWNAMA